MLGEVFEVDCCCLLFLVLYLLNANSCKLFDVIIIVLNLENHHIRDWT